MLRNINNKGGGWLNSYVDKEQTEWSNFWYDQANIEGKRRILLVGDSVARQVRRTFSELLHFPVDLFATSAALRDCIFWDQWECFFKNELYSYDTIFVWVGNHSRMSEDGSSFYKESDYTRFERDFRYLLDNCLLHSRDVIVLSTLHMFRWRKFNQDIERIRRKLRIKPKEFLNDDENIVVERKNSIMKEVATSKNLHFYDIDATLMKSRFWHTDFIHYIPESNSFVCEILKGLINNDLK